VRVELTILGQPASKANRRQLVMIGKGATARPSLIKSKEALEYERSAVRQIPRSACAMLTGPVRVTMKIYYASEQPDLDESVVLDVLQAKYAKQKKDAAGHRSRGPRELERPGVYVNDRQVREKHVYHAIDKANPRTEIVVESLAPQQPALDLPDPSLRIMAEEPF